MKVSICVSMLGPHLFICVGDNFGGARNQANCTDEAQDRDFRPVFGDFDLDISFSSTAGRWPHMTNPIGVPTMDGEPQG